MKKILRYCVVIALFATINISFGTAKLNAAAASDRAAMRCCVCGTGLGSRTALTIESVGMRFVFHSDCAHPVPRDEPTPATASYPAPTASTDPVVRNLSDEEESAIWFASPLEVGALLRRLQAKGVDLAAKVDRETLLQTAARHGNLDVVRELCAIVPDIAKNTPHILLLATSVTDMIPYGEELAKTKKNKLAVAKLLIDHGADVNAGITDGKLTPLFGVFFPEMVRLLIKNGANPHAITSTGQTPLYRMRRCFRADHPECEDTIQALILAGVDPDSYDKKGQTAEESIASGGSTDDLAVAQVIRKVANSTPVTRKHE